MWLIRLKFLTCTCAQSLSFCLSRASVRSRWAEFFCRQSSFSSSSRYLHTRHVSLSELFLWQLQAAAVKDFWWWYWTGWRHHTVDGPASHLRALKVQCVIFRDFEVETRTSSGDVLDCSTFSFLSWSHQETTPPVSRVFFNSHDIIKSCRLK